MSSECFTERSLPLIERVMLVRHKERKFGKGCLQEWTSHRKYLTAHFTELLVPIDTMLTSSPFLLSDRPLFIDYDLHGVIGNYLFSGKTKLPGLKHLHRWHRTVKQSNETPIAGMIPSDIFKASETMACI